MADPTTTDIKSDTEPWSVLENLILAQAIYKCGDTNWVAIARTIKGHPQVHRSSNFFSQKSCAIQYTQLLESLDAETRSKQSRGNEVGPFATQEIPSVVKLAGQLYNQRILEIQALIRKDEERFRALVAELDEIRQGKWDAQLAEELKKNSPPPPPESEVVDGSETTTIAIESNNTLSPVDVSQQQPEAENTSIADATAPSSLSTPSPASLSEKQDDAKAFNETLEPGNTSSRTVSATTTTSTETGSAASESVVAAPVADTEDIEMEDAAPAPSSESSLETITGAESNSANATGLTNVVDEGDEDVEMEDTTQKEPSPVEKLESTTQVNISKTAPESKATDAEKKRSNSESSSPTSASDLSPPGAMEEEEDDATPEDESETPGVIAKDASEEVKKEEDEDEEKAIIKEEDDEEGQNAEEEDEEEGEGEGGEGEGEEQAPQRKKMRTRGIRAEATPEAEESKEDDDDESTPKVEEDVNEEDDDEEDTAQEGATSADDEETESTTKSGRKPKKIRTSNVPVKRKRRSGRGSGASAGGTGGAAGADNNEEGYNSTDSETTDSPSANMLSDQLMRNQMDDKKWKKILMMIWTEISNHRFGAVFMQPIKEHDAPGYYYMIKRPMDLKSIKERIRDGQITNADEFHRDVLLMFMNALMYNGEDTEVYQMALAMMTEVEFIIKNFKSSQSFGSGSTLSAASSAGGGSGGPGGSAVGGGSGNTSNSTTPTTRTAVGGGSEMLSAGSTGSQTSTRKRKSSGLDMVSVE